MRALVALAALGFGACASERAPVSERPAALPSRCTRGQLLVDGAPSTREHAVSYCSDLRDAVVYLDDPQLESDWRALEQQLREREVHITRAGRTCDALHCGQRVRIVPLEQERKPLVIVPKTP